MAYLDNSTILHASTDSAISATSYSANWIDLNITNGQGVTDYRDLARGGDLHALITITTAASLTTAGTLEFQIVNTPATTEAAMSQASSVLTDTGDTVTWASHGFPAGTPVQFTSIVNTTGITASRPYFVAANGLASGSFKVCETLVDALSSSGTVVAMSTNGTATVTAMPHILGSTGPIPAALLTGGSQFVIRLNRTGVHCLNTTLDTDNGQNSFRHLPEYRYLAARFVETGTITTVVPKVELILDPQDGIRYYPTGYAIS